MSRVVIDAGHGGNDPGAVSPDKRIYEKSLTLDIAQKVTDKIKRAYPGVSVYQTRPDDRFVSLNDRAVKANKWNAQLFISIHINSTKSKSPNGYSVHVLGQSTVKNRDLFAYNMDVCQRENSVILLEDDYNTKYQGFDPSDPESFIFMQLMQNSHLEQSLDFAQSISDKLKKSPISANRGIWQNPFYVLWKTAMPSVLIELGFISNPDDLAVLRQDSNRDILAECLFNAFCEYKDKYDGTVHIGTAATTDNSVQKPAAKVYYGVQLFAGKNLIPSNSSAFMGYEPVIIKTGTIYKYFVAVDESLEAVRKNKLKISKKYPSAFIVKLSMDEKSQNFNLIGVL